ncbi:IS607 family transposase (plasmid) [Pseudomonas silesiensis]|uniref:IS607 family transposase n=1 Tax=Pseudomonas silesiensis TaxID=1853130 RepID=UPI0030CEEE99
MQHVSIGQASELLGVAVSTLRRWEHEGRLRPAFRTCGGHRRYALLELHRFCGKVLLEQRRVVAYARVSSHDQKADLERQRERLEQHCQAAGHRDFLVLSDLGSGLNYQKKAFRQLLKMIALGQVSQLILLHKDRLLRFGADIVFELCKLNQTEVVILDDLAPANLETRLVADVIELMTVFSARLYGSRSRKNQKVLAQKAA